MNISAEEEKEEKRKPTCRKHTQCVCVCVCFSTSSTSLWGPIKVKTLEKKDCSLENVCYLFKTDCSLFTPLHLLGRNKYIYVQIKILQVGLSINCPACLHVCWFQQVCSQTLPLLYSVCCFWFKINHLVYLISYCLTSESHAWLTLILVLLLCEVTLSPEMHYVKSSKTKEIKSNQIIFLKKRITYLVSLKSNTQASHSLQLCRFMYIIYLHTSSYHWWHDGVTGRGGGVVRLCSVKPPVVRLEDAAEIKVSLISEW